MRTFIAIELPEDLQKKLGDFIDRLRNPQDKITWVSPKNIHLTLKFLGEVSNIDSIKNVIQDVAGRFTPFSVSLVGTGVFPSLRSPRVVWIGVKNWQEDIYNELENGLFLIGIPKEERSFTPHITLGRIKYIKDLKGFGDLITKHKEDLFSNLSVDSISLVKSTLTPKGSVYETLYKIPLTGR